MNSRELFLRHVAQTSPAPLALEMVKAEGCMIWDRSGKAYLDLISGISVCNMGHRHPKVVEAVKAQADQYFHLLVYGEFVESPQVEYAHMLSRYLPASLDSVYFTNSGAEATEGAMKLAKRVTGRTEIISFRHSYHGSTQGALSIMGDEYWRNAYRPLLPGIRQLDYNQIGQLNQITTETACVVAETVQAERGVRAPSVEWMQALRQRCDRTGTLLVLDEIQAGFGRTGTLWAFEQFGIVPDILLLGKALGGGMPLGAFIAARERMWTLTADPVLGHITTFGGHPVCCAAGLASMKALLEENRIGDVMEKSSLLQEELRHPLVREIRAAGLLMAVEFDSFETNKKVLDICLENGVLSDWFLFAPECMRIAPPLVITREEIRHAGMVFRHACEQA
ncbi:MAG: aminotransferase class III-fold pyridoxal phosphate-dependent enzyme [Chitinophagaceae bacterium]|jgi:acetylornithine/succinyldiaminopimelate/putrescine aminotransferase|nr:aminotransferase class III-fold pyridoxal phosphate-dependent enzyme [Chitinophagaceae bacterium]